MTDFKSYLGSVKAEIKEVSVEDVQALIGGDNDAILVDVRQRDEIAQGTLQGALAIPRGLVEIELPKQIENKDAKVILFCAGGTRSALAAKAALALGYTNVSSMAGGFGRWKQVGAAFHMPTLPEFPENPEAGADAHGGPTTSVTDLAEALKGADAPVVIDVREDVETEKGFIPGATLQPRGFFEMRVDQAVGGADHAVVLVSSAGVRAGHALDAVQAMGYKNVTLLEGGFDAWKAAGNDVFVPRRLSPMDRLRYSRHIMIPEVGEEGQLKLLGSKVLLMGAGGLGSPAAYYLAAAGVGTLGIIDSDVVDRSNLQRQILHTDDRVGVPKVESAKQTLHNLNPELTINAYNERLTSENVEEIFSGYDLVLDGGDNFPTRYLVNDACVHLNIPCVHGSVYRFEGQVTVFNPGSGPCYRCLYPEPPPPELAPSCAEAGVLGIVPGVIGLLQATEAIKILLGAGKTMEGRLLHFDALSMKFREMKLRRDPECPVCAEGAEWQGYIDYDHFCGIG